jgi:hypothetical protein
MARLRAIAEAEAGSTNPSVTTPPISAVISFSPAQVAVFGTLTVPAVGDSVTVTATPVPGVELSTSFVAGDVAIATDTDPNGYAVHVAWFQVDSTTATTVTLSALNRPGAAAAGTIMNNVEISGQTRLPSKPAGVSSAELVVIITDEVEAAAGDAVNPYNAIAQRMEAGAAIAHYGFKPTGAVDIDFVNRYGWKLRDTGSVAEIPAVDIDNFRLVSRTPLALPFRCEVVYR